MLRLWDNAPGAAAPLGRGVASGLDLRGVEVGEGAGKR